MRPGREAAMVVLQPALRQREGVRHGSFGASGSGKSYATALLLDIALTQGACDVVFSLDDKGREAQFKGILYTNPADFAARGLPEDAPPAPHVIFRGDLRNDVVCSAEEVAGFAWDLSRKTGIAVAVNIDELASAATPAGREWTAPSVRKAFNQGRALGLSIFWTTQIPQRVPPEALDQCGTVFLFRLDGRALNYLSDIVDLPPEMTRILPTLERGDFLLYQPGQPWDHHIYRF
jgi:hypothetical protein